MVERAVRRQGQPRAGYLQRLGAPVAAIGDGEDDVLRIKRLKAVGIANGVAQLDTVLVARVSHLPAGGQVVGSDA
jgi:hypothetical protein